MSGAKREIYGLIREMSAEGRIVLFSSTELPELIGLCDRVLVFYRGRLAGELARSEVDDHSLLHMINTGEVAPGASKGLSSSTDPSPPARRRWRQFRRRSA